jgi:hypothetical protein
MKTVQVTETLHGWSIQIDEVAVFWSADQEGALKRALDMASALFEQGQKSQVTLKRARNAA